MATWGVLSFLMQRLRANVSECGCQEASRTQARTHGLTHAHTGTCTHIHMYTHAQMHAHTQAHTYTHKPSPCVIAIKCARKASCTDLWDQGIDVRELRVLLLNRWLSDSVREQWGGKFQLQLESRYEAAAAKLAGPGDKDYRWTTCPQEGSQMR